MLKNILAVTGKPGLFKLVTRGNNMLIVESLIDGKRMPTYQRDKIVSLADVSMFTEGEDIALSEVLTKLGEKEGLKVASIDPKKADNDQLRAFFANVLPNYDRDRVYPSDIRKLISWYNILINAGITDFSVEEELPEKPLEQLLKPESALKKGNLLLQHIIDIIESVAPLRWQEEWDNSGLQVGNRNADVNKVLLATDVTESVVSEAIALKCDLIISHHPLIFHPLKQLCGQTPQARCAETAIKNNIAIYSSHTAMDSWLNGVSGRMAEKIGINDYHILQPTGQDEPIHGLGVIGQLPRPITLTELLQLVKTAFEAPVLRYVPGAKDTIQTIATLSSQRTSNTTTSSTALEISHLSTWTIGSANTSHEIYLMNYSANISQPLFHNKINHLFEFTN